MALGRLGLAALIAGCGSGGGDSGSAADAAPEVDAAPAIDLAQASWELEPVEGAGDSAFGLKMAFDGEGRAIAVWQLNDASAIGFAVRDAGSWSVQLITPPAGASAVFAPDVAGGKGPEAHVVFSASTAATGSDIMYTRWDGSALSAPVNLTGAGQVASDTDTSPAIAATDSGVLAVMYNYYTNPEAFVRETRALTFTDPAAPGPFETLLDTTQNCGALRVVAVDDAVHAVALCQGGGDQVAYINNRSGTFSIQSAAIGGTSVIAPDLAIGSDGSVHIVAQTGVPCGDDTCTVPAYSINLAPGIPVAVATESYYNPSIALDRQNQPVVVFFELPDRELWWTFGTDGGFFRRQMVAPGGGKLVGTGATDPATGLPWFIVEDRENTPRVWLARLVP